MAILFGVASVIAMLAIGKGAEQEILEQMRLLGANNIVITPIVEQREGKVEATTKKAVEAIHAGAPYLDAQAITRDCPRCGGDEQRSVINSVITREGHYRSGKIVGVDSSYSGVTNLRLAEGTRFWPPHSAARPVAMIGHGVKSRFFTSEIRSAHIKVGNQWLTVVGVLEDRKVSSEIAQKLGIRDANMDVYVPLRTMLLRYRNRARGDAAGNGARASEHRTTAIDSPKTDDQRAEKRNYNQLDKIDRAGGRSEAVPAVAEVVRRMLQRRHNDVTDFEITVPELLLKQEQRTKTIFNIVLGAIASISLVVGGIGIMNIMLASILERIKEIGVRRAVGATQKDVLAQFLSEAVMISLAGGVAGIIVGGILAAAIERIAQDSHDRVADVGGRRVRRVGRGRPRVRHRAGVARREAGPDRLPPLRVGHSPFRMKGHMRIPLLLAVAAVAALPPRIPAQVLTLQDAIAMAQQAGAGRPDGAHVARRGTLSQ